jgi:hypothetical protein
MSEVKTIKDATHWKQLVKSNWLRGADLDPNADVILTVKSIDYTKPDVNTGIDDTVLVIKWVEQGWKPYGTTTVENLKALASVYGSDNPNDWKTGQKLALYPKVVKAFGETAPAVRIRTTAPQFVSAEQIDELNKLIDESKSDRAKFLVWARIEQLEDMQFKQFAKAKQILSAKVVKDGLL